MRNRGQSEQPEYVAPSLTTIQESDLLDQLGPAQAYTGNFPFGF